MKDANNDNEPLPFTKIGLHAALVLNKLRNKIQAEAADEQPDASSESGDKQRESEKRAYVDQRLKEIAAFERRVSGQDRPRNKRMG